MINAVKVSGNVTGRMLAGAMIRMHAAVPGGLEHKQNFGVGVFNKYLSRNSARLEAWAAGTKLKPEVVLARASMSGEWLRQAGELIEASTDAGARKSLLGRMIALSGNAENTKLPLRIRRSTKASELAPLLEPAMPRVEIEMAAIGSPHSFRCGKYPVTNRQYQIYVEQTGDEKQTCGSTERLTIKSGSEIIFVKYGDALRFLEWQQRRLLTVKEGGFAAQNADIFGLKGMSRIWEWRRGRMLASGLKYETAKENVERERKQADSDHSFNTGYYSADDFIAAQNYYQKHRNEMFAGPKRVCFRAAENF